jgi:DNA-binding NarL/FixJ family response regulator
VNIVLVDDHPLIRSGLINALSASGFKVVGEAVSVAEGLAVINSTKPQVCIVDVNLGANSGIDLIRTSISAKVDCKFIVLTIQDDLETLNSAKAAGACAYVTKGAPIENLIEVIQSISSSDQNFVKVGEFKAQSPKKDFQLTEREIEVLSLLPSGTTAAALGSVLFLTEATIKTHLASIYRKLGASNRAQAVSIAISENLIPKK